MSYSQAVGEVMQEFHKSERHVMRLVGESKYLIGEALKDRERRRAWLDLCAQMDPNRAPLLGPFREQTAEEFAQEVEDLIRAAVEATGTD